MINKKILLITLTVIVGLLSGCSASDGAVKDIDKQIKCMADNVAQIFPDEDNIYAVTVTDYDQNGLLEIVFSNNNNSGNYTYSYMYEMKSDLSGLEEVKYGQVDEDEYTQPDIIVNEAKVFKDDKGYHYVFDDLTRSGYVWLHCAKQVFTKKDNSISVDTLGHLTAANNEESENEFIVEIYDANDNIINIGDYRKLDSEKLSDSEELKLTMNWEYVEDASELSVDMLRKLFDEFKLTEEKASESAYFDPEVYFDVNEINIVYR